MMPRKSPPPASGPHSSQSAAKRVKVASVRGALASPNSLRIARHLRHGGHRKTGMDASARHDNSRRISTAHTKHIRISARTNTQLTAWRQHRAECVWRQHTGQSSGQSVPSRRFSLHTAERRQWQSTAFHVTALIPADALVRLAAVSGLACMRAMAEYLHDRIATQDTSAIEPCGLSTPPVNAQRRSSRGWRD